MIIQVSDLTKRFGGLLAVSNVSFEVNEGEIVALIGPNGAGKTTLFNLINGFYKPDAGKIIFSGRDVTGLPPNRLCKLGIGRTFQIVKPFKSMTVQENIDIPSFFGRRNDGPPRDSVEDVLKLTGLFGKRGHHVESLTLEERKRLEIARGLASGPRLLLLDEVLAGLNPVEVTAGMELIRKIRSIGVSIIMIEHVMEAVMGVSDRIVVLDHGEKIAEGPPESVVSNQHVIEAYLGSGDLD